MASFLSQYLNGTVCSVCGRGLKSEIGLVQHKENKGHHNSKEFRRVVGRNCPDCYKKLRSSVGVLCHMFMKHHTSALSYAHHETSNACTVSFKVLASKHGLEQHRRDLRHYFNTANGLPGILEGAAANESLDSFMQRKVWPDLTYTKKSKEAVMRLKTFMEHNTKYSVNRVYVSGSQGKKTDLRGNSDVDLVMFINDYPTMAIFMSNLRGILENLKGHLQNDSNWAKEVRNIKITPFGVEFEVILKGYDDYISVDLLPALDLPGKVSNMDEIFREMRSKDKDENKCYSICFTQLQAEFVDKAPSKVKDLIRLVKYWKKTEEVPGKSYFIELLIVYLWEQLWGEPAVFNMNERFREVIANLKNIHQMKIVWPNTHKPAVHGPLPASPPVLLDPVNPLDNVAPAGSDVGIIANKAASLLRRMDTP